MKLKLCIIILKYILRATSQILRKAQSLYKPHAYKLSIKHKASY